MSHNVGSVDRVLRVILGLAFVVLFFMVSGSVWGWVFLALGLVALATGALGACPLYSLLGIRTCKLRS